MYPYGAQPKMQNLIWQDRRDRNIPVQERQQQQGDKWWNKIKKKTATETPDPAPARVFSMDKGMLGGRSILNIQERPKEHQLFNLENLDEGPIRPQLNLGDISSQFSRSPLDSNSQAESGKSDLASAAPEEIITPLKEPDDSSTDLYQIPLVNPTIQTVITNQAEFKTVSETEIIKPPSPFMDQSRRRPPPVPNAVLRPQSFILKNNYEYISVGKQRGNFVKDAVSLFEKNSRSPSPTGQRKMEPEMPAQHMIEPVVQDKVGPPLIDYINIKIPNKAANTRQRSRGPSRTPSDLDLSRQITPTEIGDISKEFTGYKNRLSKSYDLPAPEKMEVSFSRDPSFSDAGSLDSRLDSLEPQAKERKASVLRGFINATRSKINLDSKLDREKSNTDPLRKKLRRSSSAKAVKSEIRMDTNTDFIRKNSTSSKFGKKRKPSHLELQQGFNMKGFDNFMMY
ncbi:hypothetical protein LOD99_4245 [Oopsacas minuta]|uniref:Uncharacterized protein n=1 Tax=Oopsacas minuta TaxID=111878 RepID=A0AAV7JVC4_9METZ|nr:hypothetical protein LOD99_4245 [Oopsacas minuta]